MDNNAFLSDSNFFVSVELVRFNSVYQNKLEKQ